MKTQRIGNGETTWVKARDLVGRTFTIESVRSGRSPKSGPSFYLTLGDGRLLGVGQESLIGSQIRKVGMNALPSKTQTYTVSEHFSDSRQKNVYTLDAVLPDDESAETDPASPQ